MVSVRELFAAPADQQVRDVMRHRPRHGAGADMDQEAVSRLFAEHDLIAVPVVDGEGA